MDSMPFMKGARRFLLIGGIIVIAVAAVWFLPLQRKERPSAPVSMPTGIPALIGIVQEVGKDFMVVAETVSLGPPPEVANAAPPRGRIKKVYWDGKTEFSRSVPREIGSGGSFLKPAHGERITPSDIRLGTQVVVYARAVSLAEAFQDPTLGAPAPALGEALLEQLSRVKASHVVISQP